tara:strand:- start:167 stop:1114 length:948 start_codon:yes stop_codon:yes gene_type:complete
MTKEENWEKVEAPVKEEEEKIEVEVEKDDATPSSVESKAEAPAEKELEGIETKGAQKRIRQLIKQRKDKEDQVAQLVQQNEQLQNLVKQRETEFTSVNQKNLEVTEKQLTDKLQMARTAYKNAYEAGDQDKLLSAQEMLNEAQVDLKNVNVTKEKFKNVQQAPRQPVASPQQYQQPVPAGDPKAQDWARNNEWFGKDNVMTASALAIDAELKAEGYETGDDEFYQEVDKRIREAFPTKFQEVQENNRQQGTSRPAQVVAGASRSTPNSKKVRLSKDEVNIATKWNIPLEQYAQEKMKATQADGEYTTINMQRGGK